MNKIISFDPFEYKKLYADLENLYGQELYNHYLNLGIKEERIYKEYKNIIPNVEKIYCYISNSDSRINLDSSKIKLITNDTLNLLGDEEIIIFINNNLDFDLTENKLYNFVELYLSSFCDFLSPLIVSKDKKLVYFGSFVKDSYLIYVNEKFISNNNIKRNIVQNTFLFFKDLFVCRKKNLHNYLKNQYDEFSDKSLVFKISTFIEFSINCECIHNTIKLNNILYEKYELKENIEFIKQFLYRPHPSTIKMQKYKYLDSNSYPYICLIMNRIITPDQDFNSFLISRIIDELLKLKFNLHYYVLNGKINNDYSIFILKKGIKIIYLTEEELEDTFENHLNLYKYVLYSQYEINYDLLMTIKNLNPIANHIFISMRNNLSTQIIKEYDIIIIWDKSEFEYFNTKEYTDKIIYYSKFISDANDLIYRKPIYKTRDMYFIGSLKDENEIPLIYFLNHIYPILLSYQPIKFYIIGKICIKLKKYEKLFHNNLILVDYMAESDLKKFFTEIRVHLVINVVTNEAPNNIETVLRGKMLQSMKYGIPTIIINSNNEINKINKNNRLEYEFIKCEFDKNNKYSIVKQFFKYYNNLELLKKSSFNLLNWYLEKSKKESENNSLKKLLNTNYNFNPVKNNFISVIIVVFQIYSCTISDLENYCIYFSNFKSYYFKIIFVNNNISKNFDNFKIDEQNKEMWNNLDFKIIEGDNSYYDFSGYQKGLDFVRDNKYEFNAILIINETINERTPIYLHQIKSKIFNIASTQNVVIGHIDKNPNPIILQNKKINCWVRSNFILINRSAIESLNFSILLLKNYNEISLDPETEAIINTRMNRPYYQKYNGNTLILKKLLILNEFFFSFNLSLYSKLIDFNQI